MGAEPGAVCRWDVDKAAGLGDCSRACLAAVLSIGMMASAAPVCAAFLSGILDLFGIGSDER